MTTRIRRTPEQITAFNKAVKKAVGRAAAGKKYADIKAKLAANLGADIDSINDAHLRRALSQLVDEGTLASEGNTRATVYTAA